MTLARSETDATDGGKLTFDFRIPDDQFGTRRGKKVKKKEVKRLRRKKNSFAKNSPRGKKRRKLFFASRRLRQAGDILADLGARVMKPQTNSDKAILIAIRKL